MRTMPRLSMCVQVVVLDRPNPIGGAVVEGPVLRAEEGFVSDVGRKPVALRHGLTVRPHCGPGPD